MLSITRQQRTTSTSGALKLISLRNWAMLSRHMTRGGTTVSRLPILNKLLRSQKCTRFCAALKERRTEFANSMDNLTFAALAVNRAKGNKGSADWMPNHNKCRYIGT